MRVMIDTNIFISSILFPNSLPARLVEDVLYKHNLVLCSQIIEELHEVFNRKFETKIKDLEKFLSCLSYELVYTPLKINNDEYPEIRDEKDLPILVSAVLSDVDCFVTGDKDFFDVEIERPEIVSAKEFLKSSK
ncbi:MAG: putative toxin-antitoxin system toxin component, PIN family [Halanaerobiales bacterium]